MGLREDVGRGRTGIDSSVVIYFIEEHPKFLAIIQRLFDEADAGSRELVTSALTLLEVMVVPYRAGNIELAARYEAILTNSRGISLIDISREQLRDAAQLRAATGLRTPDALQLAAAIAAGCTTFVTNDRRIPSVTGMRVLQLQDYLQPV